MNKCKRRNFNPDFFAALGAARTRLLHLEPRQGRRPHGGAGAAAAALQRGAAVGDDRGAALLVALQASAAHQEVHQDRLTVSSSAHLRPPVVKSLYCIWLDE